MILVLKCFYFIRPTGKKSNTNLLLFLSTICKLITIILFPKLTKFCFHFVNIRKQKIINPYHYRCFTKRVECIFLYCNDFMFPNVSILLTLENEKTLTIYVGDLLVFYEIFYNIDSSLVLEYFM